MRSARFLDPGKMHGLNVHCSSLFSKDPLGKVFQLRVTNLGFSRSWSCFFSCGVGNFQNYPLPDLSQRCGILTARDWASEYTQMIPSKMMPHLLLWNFLAPAHCRSPKCHTEVGENNPLNHGTQFMCEFELSSKCHVAAWAGENSPSCLKRLRRSPRNGFKFMPLHALQ